MTEQVRSYEENIKKLEEIVRRLEQGEIPLEEGLACFEEGMTLVRSCHQQLERVAQKIKLLTQEGELQDLPMILGEE